MKAIDSNYFEEFKESTISHNLKSGEIIIFIYNHNINQHHTDRLIREFLLETGIKISNPSFHVSKYNKPDAIKSMKYGLSTKPNYTSIDKEFNESDINSIVNRFIEFFNSPNFYSINSKIYLNDLDLNDYWETGGSILIDKDKIGILWINDLYDLF